MKKYIFFDIDHTLISHVNAPHIPPQTREAVNLLKISGHIPAIATGRASFLTFKTADELGINYLVCSGGSQIFVNGEEVFTLYFPEEHLQKVFDAAKKFPELTVAADRNFLYTDGDFRGARKYFALQAGYDCIKPLSEVQRKIIMSYIMIPRDELTPEHGIFFAPPENINLEYMKNFTEARLGGITKWRGIELLIQHENASLDDVITFGDGPNDADMLRNAAVGVAVGKCSEEARAAADFVCDDIDDGGIFSACKTLGLI